MKKKLMMVAVLMGALTLGACVDNNETQSVTDVRNAKVAQLKARAEMNNAEAEAAQVLAAAEVQLMNAKAAAAKANAAMASAETATIQKQKELVELQKEAAELQNEAALVENLKAQAELEAALSDLEVAKKQAEADLARIAAELEANQLYWAAQLAQAQADLLVAKQDLADELADDPTAAEKLEALVNAYSKAVENLIDAQRALTIEKSFQVRLEEDLISAEEYKAQQIAQNNNSIANYEAQIAVYKEYTNYLEDADVETLKAEYEKLDDEYSILRDKLENANKEWNNLPIDLTAANEADAAFWDNEVWQLINNRQVVLTDEEGNKEFIWLYYYPYSQIVNFIPNYNSFNFPYEEIVYNEFTESFYNKIEVDVNELTADAVTLELAFNDQIASVNNSKKMYEEWLADAQAQYDGKATEVIGYDEEDEPILKDIRNAVDSVAFLKNAYETETDDAKKAELRYLYEQAIDRKIALENDIQLFTTWVTDEAKKITVFETVYEMLADWDATVAELQAVIDARNEAFAAAYAEKIELWKAWVDAEIACIEKYAEINAVSSVLYGSYATGAASIQSNIQQLEQNIADLKKANEDLSSIESAEEAIEYGKARIAALEAVVAARQVAVNEAKAELDAAMAE